MSLDDLAACPLGLDAARQRFWSIGQPDSISPDIIAHHSIGPGDDVFMVGRFLNHDGKLSNSPTVRFGNIAMMNEERIRHSDGHDQESFLVETRSQSGYSGSPVFVYVSELVDRDYGAIYVPSPGPWLLGVTWCQLPHFAPVVFKDDHDSRVDENWVVKSNTGMTGVVPAWKVDELLMQEKFAEQRRKDD